MELNRSQVLSQALHRTREQLRILREEDHRLTWELMATMGEDEQTLVQFPDDIGVMQEVHLKHRGALDPGEVSKVYEHLHEAQADSDKRKLVYKEVKETMKVDAVRAKQVEKLGGEVGQIIKRAREIGQSPYLSIKEQK